MITATASYRDESDALARFVAQRCLTGPHHAVGLLRAVRGVARLVRAEGEDPGTQTAFARTVTDRGLDKFKDGYGRMRWRGIALAADEDGGAGP